MSKKRAYFSLQLYARQKTKQAFDTIVNIMEQPKTPPQARLMAAGMIIDRGWGKAAQVLAIDGELLAIDGELRQVVEVKLKRADNAHGRRSNWLALFRVARLFVGYLMSRQVASIDIIRLFRISKQFSRCIIQSLWLNNVVAGMLVVPTAMATGPTDTCMPTIHITATTGIGITKQIAAEVII